MQNFIPLASPDIQEKDIDAVSAVLRTGNLVQGEQVEQLENNLAKYLGVAHCVAVTNGTATLHLALVALGIGPGDEVIVPALSYIATANVVELVGARPVFVDITLDSFNINADLIEAKITPRTKAIIIVHEFGLAADMHRVKAICDAYQLWLVEDAACALGAKDQDSLAGTVGIAGSFSFHPRKAITSGEGGAIITSDAELALHLRTLRNHGMNAAHKSKMDFILAGYNCRMTNFQAALLDSQLQRLDAILGQKQHIADRYLNEIKNPHIKLPVIAAGKLHSWQTFHVLLQGPLKQAETIAKLRDAGIGTNYGAQCMPAQTYFLEKYKHNAPHEFPQAWAAYQAGLAIPLYEKLNGEQVSYIIQTLNSI
jgi:dTDP-4-amino-4,6-dideoxygalactose transaminase